MTFHNYMLFIFKFGPKTDILWFKKGVDELYSINVNNKLDFIDCILVQIDSEDMRTSESPSIIQKYALIINWMIFGKFVILYKQTAIHCIHYTRMLTSCRVRVQSKKTDDNNDY